MIKNLRSFKIYVFLFIAVFAFSNALNAQIVKSLADEVTFTSGNNKMTSLLGCGFGGLSPCFTATVVNPNNALNDDGTFARLLASPGLLAGLSSYNGVIELKFPQTLSANTTTYIRIDGDSDLLGALLGGSLGDALADVLGSLLLGRQEIRVQARNSGGSTVLNRASSDIGGFNTDMARLVTDQNGDFFLAIKPNQEYDRVRISNNSISLLGLGSEYTLDVYNAFTLEGEDPCVQAQFTSFDAAGINVDLLGLGSSGVNDPENAIDGNLNTFSSISPGLLSVGGTISQFFYFGGDTAPNDEIQVTISGTPSLLDVNLLGDIRFIAYNGSDVVFNETLGDLNTNLLGILQLDLLGLLSDGNQVNIPIQPGEEFDRLEVRLSTVLNLDVLEALRIHNVVKTPGRPTFENEGDANLLVCNTDEVTFSVLSQPGDIVNWYAQPIGGASLFTGNDYFVGNLSRRTTFYAGITRADCPEESARVAVTADIDPDPRVFVNGSQVFNVVLGESLQLPEAFAINADNTEVPTTYQGLSGAPFTGPDIAGPFLSGGRFVYRASATGDNCENFVDIVVNVLDLDDCPLVYIPQFSNDGQEVTESNLLGIQLGLVSNPINAVDGDLSTFSLLEETVGTSLLGLTGETSQMLKWNVQIPAGNPVTIKLGRELGGVAQVAAGVYVQAFDNGEPVGPRVLADGNLVSVLNGFNEFNFTYTPTNFSGQAVSYDAIKVGLLPLLNTLQTVRVYGAYFNETSNTAAVCEPNLFEIQTGFLSLIGGLDVASGLTGVFDPELAVDGDFDTYATLTNAVGVNIYSRLEIAYNYPAFVGDSLNIKIGILTGLLDLAVLEGFRIQRFLGNEAIGDPVALSSSLLSLTILGGGSVGELSLVTDVPFDRIQILYGGLASVLEELWVFEVELITNSPIDGEFFDEDEEIWKLEICEGDLIDVITSDCEEVKFYTTADGDEEITPAAIALIEGPTELIVYVQSIRYGCEVDSKRRELHIIIDATDPPVAEAEQDFCAVDNPTLVSIEIEGENILWYDAATDGNLLEITTPLVDGETYFASQTIEDGCESMERTAVTVSVVDILPPTTDMVVQEFCVSDSPTIAQLQVVGNDIVWYDAIENGNVLPINTPLVNGETYYASQTDEVSGCESSERLAVTVVLENCESFLNITKTASSPTVLAGENITYSISVSNSGLMFAENFVVTDEIPEGTEFVSASNGGVFENGIVTWNLDNLEVGGEIFLELVLSTLPDLTSGTIISNTALASSTNNEGGPIESDPEDVEVETAADLTITKTAASSTVLAGENISYTITVSNNGPSDALDVMVSDMLPAGTAFVSADNGGVNDSGTVNWNLGTLSAGASVELNLVLSTESSLEAGMIISNIAVVESPTDENSPKECDPSEVLVETAADLNITKTASSPTVLAGENISYTITVSNNGPSDALEVKVSDMLPAGTAFVSADNGGVNDSGTVNWNLGTLSAGASMELNLVLSTETSLEAGLIISNIAIVDSPTDEDGPKECDPSEVLVETAADLTITKTAASSTVLAGENISYTITVSNNGPSDALDVMVSDMLPAGTAFVSADNGGVNDSGTVNWNLGTLSAGASVELNLVLSTSSSLEAGTTISNIAIVDSPTDEDGPKESDPEDVEVETVADLTIVKTASSPTVIARENISYTITVSNAGPSDALEVMVSDMLPAGTTFVSADNGGVNDSGTVNWNLGTLSAGASVELNLVLSTSASLEAGTTISNIAIVDSPTDEDGPKESDPEDVEVETAADLTIVKTASSPTVIAGENISYTITVSNNGPSDALNVMVSDMLPAGTAFVSADNGGVNDSGTVNWNLGTLSAGASVEMNLVLSTESSIEAGTTISNIAIVDSPTDEDGPKESDPEDVEVETAADLTIVKTASSPTVIAGENISYTITVSNAGPSDALEVMVSDMLPAGTAFVSAENGGVNDSGTVNWNLGTLSAGASVELNLVLSTETSLEAGTTISNIAIVDSPTDEDGPKESDPEDVEVETAADLTITKTASSPTVLAGENISYTITVSNAGPSDALEVMVSDMLPAGTAFVSADNGGVNDSGTVNWNLGNLLAGASVELNLVLSTETSLEAGLIISNIAIVDSPTDEDGPKESDPEDVEVETAADLTIVKTASSPTVLAGENISYTITVSNAGPSDALDVMVSDMLPTGTAFVSADNGGVNDSGTVNWNLGTLSAGASVELNLVLSTSSSLEAGTTISNIAIVDSPTDEDGPKECDPSEVLVETAADLTITKTASSPTVIAGENISYTITVSNNGPSDALEVMVSDMLPAGTAFVSADNGGVNDSGTVNWNLGTLSAGASVELNLVLSTETSLEAGTTISNIAIVDSPTDEDGPKECDPSEVLVETAADLTITKTASSPTVIAGENISYTITVSNNGPSDALEVMVSDMLPAGTAFVSADNGGVNDSGTVNWNLGTLSAGASVELNLVLSTETSLEAGTTISNIAIVDSPTDEDGPKESDPEDVEVETAADLTITKTASSPTVIAGENISYTITVSNNGPSDALDVMVSDMLPAGTAFVSADNGGVNDSGTVNWNLGTLSAGASVELNLVLSTDENLDLNYVIRNIAVVTSPSIEEDEIESEPEDVTILDDTTIISVTKTSDIKTASPGDIINYTIRISNEGEFAANNITVVDSLPAGLTIINMSHDGQINGDQITWDFEELQPNQTINIGISAVVTLEAGGIVNRVIVSGDNFEEVIVDAEEVVINVVDLSIAKTVSSPMVMVGMPFNYFIKVSNNSQANATEVVVTDFIPLGVRFVDAQVSTGSFTYNATTRVLRWEIDLLEASGEVEMTLNVEAQNSGQISNTARVASRELDINVEDNDATITHVQIEMNIPNVFTPNGDGINDTWVIEGITHFFSTNKLIVVNRWGVEVFRTDNYDNDWNGGNLTEGAYFYQLTAIDHEGREQVFTGYVTILR
ncbi:gliding motility-associated C-terminal domain-containing protein [Belliella sp. DSM 107340]|uniref:Gliding motility-associated C-terminal domain-containing protein n=1 Tax=Belliella calami TaxID=2923436 RepID=A0ABS9UJZ3_9BACT|nr:gliding motility-associated C-terminal domain-containing protein [Belliella calami]MCH7396490.1 gliding motility-associated C-terminal domain-containing protein [Belliella calami]